MTTEREAKLIPNDAFGMPTFEGLVAVSQPVRELDATYYDTPDLELVRWGITLRFRTGEPGAPWTLKLPDDVSNGVIAREELAFDGEIDIVPDEARDVVRCFTRGSPLRRVTRLHTTRLPVQVRDADGQTLVEIDDDSISVVDGVRTVDHFREVEVEATADSPASRAALHSTVAALIHAGCRAERPVPKLVRAIGRQAQEPPSVVVMPVGRHTSTADLIRHLTAASVVQMLMHDPGVRLGHDPEALHRYRVATRRLRSDLRTFSRLLDADLSAELRDELQWLGSTVGPARDLDVLEARLAANARLLSDVDQPATTELLARLAVSKRAARDGLLAALRSDRYDGTLRTLVKFATEPPIAAAAYRKAKQPAAHVASSLVKRRWNQLAAAVDTMGEHPTDTELHQIRIAAKRCRYAAEAVAPVVGGSARRFAAGVEAIQAVLGDYHDTVVAEAWLRNAAIELVDARVAIGGLIAIERQERAHLRDEWPNTWHRASKSSARNWL